jgi:flagellar biosynthesis anti-sigma factor FlgM
LKKINPHAGPVRAEQAHVERRQQHVPMEVERRRAVAEDRAEFSARSEQLRALRAQLQAMPEVRGERVAQLREAVRAGRFEVSTEALAEALIRELGPRGPR